MQRLWHFSLAKRCGKRIASVVLVLSVVCTTAAGCQGGTGECAEGLCAIGQEFDIATLLLTSALYTERIQMVSEALGTWEVGALQIATTVNQTAAHQITFTTCAENPAACAMAVALDMKGACVTERADGFIQRSRIVIPLEFFAELANEPYEIRRKVVIHEIGHCLGLGHATSINDVMAPSLWGAVQPSHAERYAVRSVYEMRTPSPRISERIAGDPIFTLVLPSGNVKSF